jgi:uncharacterized protein (DUF488 family)
LTRHGVESVADVRSHPYSRFNPQFNKSRLELSLAAAGIGYGFLGRELGARSADPACMVEGRVDYERLAGTPAFQRGLDVLGEHAATKRVALLCAERDPLTCHRAILVARRLQERGFVALHIREDSSLESRDAADARLLEELGMEPDLLRSRAELVDEAYRRRGAEIAYAPDRRRLR